MKWGVRRPRGSDGTVGGHTSSHDAERAKEYHQRAKEHGTHTLSNTELEHLTRRMNLEQQYSRLASGGRKNAGAKFVGDLLTQVGKQQALRIVNEAATKAVAGALKKG